MAVKFRKDLQTLVDDVLRAGYTIQSVEQTADARGRDVEVRLSNGVTINWDPQSRSIWAEGPQRLSQKTESYLRRIYEGGRFSRMWALNPILITSTILLAAAAWVIYLSLILKRQ